VSGLPGVGESDMRYGKCVTRITSSQKRSFVNWYISLFRAVWAAVPRGADF